jgi:hypothetical protein
MAKRVGESRLFIDIHVEQALRRSDRREHRVRGLGRCDPDKASLACDAVSVDHQL